MAHDLEVPARFGIVMPTGDTVGPSGISRSLRNIPVMLDLARAVEARSPDAWLLNLTNPMTTLCRTVTKHTSVKTIGLCHEVTREPSAFRHPASTPTGGTGSPRSASSSMESPTRKSGVEQLRQEEATDRSLDVQVA